VFKLNNLFGNIFHFWGDAFDKSHLDKSCIAEAHSVIVLSDPNDACSVIKDGTAITIVRMIEQFYHIERLIVEIHDPKKVVMLGYEPKDLEIYQNFYYWPFAMNGKVLITSLFESMIAWTQDDFNHLTTMKKLVSNNFFKKPKLGKNKLLSDASDDSPKNLEEHSNLLSL